MSEQPLYRISKDNANVQTCHPSSNQQSISSKTNVYDKRSLILDEPDWPNGYCDPRQILPPKHIENLVPMREIPLNTRKRAGASGNKPKKSSATARNSRNSKDTWLNRLPLMYIPISIGNKSCTMSVQPSSSERQNLSSTSQSTPRYKAYIHN